MTVYTSRFGFKWNYAAHDSGWGADYNFTHRALSAMLHPVITDDSLTTPPSSPAEDATYFIPNTPSATGAWTTQNSKIAVYQGGAWEFYTPLTGVRAYIVTQGGFFWWNGASWTAELTSGGGTFVETVAGHAPDISGDVALVVGDITGAAPLSSPALTGTPTAPTQTAHNNSTRIATTAYVDGAITALGGVVSITNGTGIGVAYASGVYTISVTGSYAPLASPTFTGTPAAPTASAGTNTTQIATTAFVQAGIAALVNSAPSLLDTLGEIATELTSAESTATALATTVAAKAPLASPTFTGTVTIPAGASISGFAPLASPTFTGTPAAPTATAGTNTTQLATTAFVQAAAAAGGVVTSVATRTGAITLAVADVSGAAPLASPTFTGTPAAPTPLTADNSTKLATTAYVQAQGYGTGTGSGSVTSVDLTMPALFSVTGNPVTGSGTLAVALATQTANRVLAGPTTGSPAAPTFRALVTADMPSMPYDISFFAEGVLTTSEVIARFVVPRTVSLASGASGVAICGTAPTGATAVVTLNKNGSSFGTVTYSTGSTTGTVSITSTTSFAAGDIITWVGPSSVDVTLADPSVTLTATR